MNELEQFSGHTNNSETTANDSQNQELHQTRATWFRKLALPSICYAFCYTICNYHNDYGIGIFIWIVLTICFANYVLKQSNVTINKKSSYFYLIIMCALGISTILTTNLWILFCNRIGFYLLLVYFLLLQTQNTGSWNIWDACCAMLEAIIGAISQLPAPIQEWYSWFCYKEHHQKQREQRRLILIGIGISIPCVLFLGMLLKSADAVFGSMFSCISFDGILSIEGIVILIMFFFGLFAFYCGMHYILTKSAEAQTESERVVTKHPAIIAQIFTTAILALYACFCLIQIVFLFGGWGTLPRAMTYANYARSGFFQLLFVCILNLLFVIFVKYRFETSKYLNVVLFGICICSYIMTASSAYRMILYIQAYHLTVLRIVVLVALFTIALILTCICRHIFDADFHLLKWMVVIICVMYTLFSLMHVDRFVAAYNLNYLTEHNAPETMRYLRTLSLDAIPVTLDYLKNADEESYAADLYHIVQAEYLYPDISDEKAVAALIDSYDGWLSTWLRTYEDVLCSQGPSTWNLSIYQAKNALQAFFLPD